ncbi:MAG TPA: lysylphosphatidylglycerol synthase domain-containing protein [Anaeromyxobacteraceae bacterium]|nr:lysylphosphatidylglycerol synthase domain-containing protein [Anaeromyxobacteraceae bacterium]
MPWRKRLVLAGAVAVGLALLAAAAWLLAEGHPWFGSGLFVATLVAAAAALEIFWVRWDLSVGSLRSGRRDSRQVALTFDDGPGPDTPAVLDALDAAGVKATFFVLGRAAEERPELVRELARRGHLVALHGYSHKKLHVSGPGTVARELDEGRATIERAGVAPAPFFRAPHGWKGPILGRALKKRGLTLVGWTRGVWDTERPGTESIANRASEKIRGGEILLLHDGCGTPGIDPRREQTAEALPEIVRRWRDAGYEFVTVDALTPGAPALTLDRVVRGAGVALLVGLGIVAVRRLDLAALRDAFAQARVLPLLLATAANLFALAAQSLRWLALVRPVAPRARPWDAYISTVAGFAVGMLMPARASDFARMHIFSRRTGSSMASVGGTLVLDHVMSSASLIAFIGAFLVIVPLPAWAKTAVWTTLGIAVVAATVLWALRPRAGHTEDEHGLRGFIGRARTGLKAAGEPRALALSVMAALAGWALEVAIGLFALDAFGIAPTVEAGVLLVLATTISAAISISPGNAGAFEVAVVLALGGMGVPPELALAFGIGYHAVHLVPVGIIGGGFLLHAGYRGGVVREEA